MTHEAEESGPRREDRLRARLRMLQTALRRETAERERVERVLQEHTEKFRSALQTSDCAFIVLSPQRRILEFNRGAEDIFGCDREQVLGEDYFELFLPEEIRSTVDEDMKKVLAGERTVGYENAIRRRDGTERVLLWNVGRLVDADGRPSGIIAIGQDITDRKQTERALRESEARFRIMADTAPVMIWITEPDKRCSYVNKGWLDFTGRSIEQELGDGWVDGIHPEDAERCLETYSSAFDARQAFTMEYRMRAADGEHRWILDHGIPRYSPDGSFAGYIGSCIEITDRKRTEDQLRESEERFRIMADTAPVMIWMAGLDKQCTYFNKGWLEFTGRTLEQELGNGWVEGVHPDDHDHCLETYVSAFDRRQEFKMEYRLKGADGEYHWILDHGSPRHLPDGRFAGYIGSGIEITERKRSEASLRQALREVETLKNQLQAENVYLQEEIRLDRNFEGIVGESAALKKVLRRVEQVASTDASVFLQGETGTGKELIARAIHDLSLRRDRPLVKIDCAALPPSLIESELFGHEKGAFTGAVTQKIGRFELADGGTVFLDEVGDLPPELQAKLLRVLQEGSFERVGNPRTIQVDVRVIAATNRDLGKAVRSGEFREDLYYRLNVFPVFLPPLRMRTGDIPLLVRSFVDRFAKKMGKQIETIPQEVMEALRSYSWPGNVRELQNVIERAVILAQGTTLWMEEGIDVGPVRRSADRRTLENVEREYILSVLEETGRKIEGKGGAAAVLGLKPSTLRSRMQKLRIRRGFQG